MAKDKDKGATKADELAAGDGAGTALPPASNEERVDDSLETEFERRVARLTEIAEEAQFESGSLLGDIRDTLLDIFKTRPKPWSQMSESEMRDLGKGLEATAKVILKKVVVVIAEEEEVSVHALVKGFSAKGDTFKVAIEAKGDEETAVELFRMDGHEVIMIRADSKRFHGQRRDGEVLPDQPGLEFSDAEPKPPADDSDLAGADETSDEETDEDNADAVEA